MAYLAYEETELSITQSKKKTLDIRLKAALNFNEEIIDKVDIMVYASNGDSVKVTLSEKGPFSKYLSGSVWFKNGKVKLTDKALQTRKKDTISISYGLGYFKKETTIILK